MKLYNFVVFFEDRSYNRVLESGAVSLEANSSSVLNEAFYSSDGWAHINMIAAIKLFEPSHFNRAVNGVVGKAVEGEEAGLNGTFISVSGEPIIWKYMNLGNVVMAYTSIPEDEVPPQMKRGCVFAAGDAPGAPNTPLRRIEDSLLTVVEAPMGAEPSTVIALSQKVITSFNKPK